MTRVAALVLAVAALAAPASAFAKGKPVKSVPLKAGMACTTKKAATYKAHHLTCTKGHLMAMKTKTKSKKK